MHMAYGDFIENVYKTISYIFISALCLSHFGAVGVETV
jgi:hypothetical protein